MLYRIEESLAVEQATFFLLGLAAFAATIVFLRDYHVLERYRYLIALGSIALLLAPRLPGVGSQVNGAFLAIDLGASPSSPPSWGRSASSSSSRAISTRRASFSPSAARRVMGLTIPPIKHFGPLLVVWGAAMVMLVFIRDLGSSLMFFGAFLALVYVATNRFSYVLIGLVLFFAGAWFFAGTVGHVQDRVDIWIDPFANDAPEGAGQITSALFTQAEGGLFGQGLGESLLKLPGPFAPSAEACNGEVFPSCGSILPEPHTDFIFAVIVAELGAVRRLRPDRDLRPDRITRLQDRGDGAGRVLEAPGDRPHGGVLPAGVRDHRRRRQADPADGRDAALHLGGRQLGRGEHDPARAASPHLREGARRPGQEGCSRCELPDRPPLCGILLLFTGLVVFTSRWSVLEADELESRTENRRLMIQEQQIERGSITSSDGVLIAESNPAGGEENPNQRVFVRNYPTGSLFGNPVGRSFVDIGRTGIELSENDLLSGDQNEFATLIDQLSGSTREGADITLTLDAEAQQVATDELQSAIAANPGAIGGSVVAIEPDTGAIRAMASVPGYDPNTIRNEKTFSQLSESKQGPLRTGRLRTRSRRARP